jgi:hypothetical protein
MRWIGLLLATGAALALTACAGAGGGDGNDDSFDPASFPTVTPTATPTAPPQLCAFPSGVMPTMVYPASGDLNVPDDVPYIEVQDNANAYYTWLPGNGNYYYADLFTHPATQVTESNFHGPQSSGFTLVSTSYGTIYGTNTMLLSSGGFGGGAIAPHTQYFVYLEYYYGDGSGNSCYANGPIGSFTTQ